MVNFLNNILSNTVGATISIIIGGVVTPLLVNAIKVRTTNRNYKKAMLTTCLKEIKSNLTKEPDNDTSNPATENESNKVEDVANNILGRTTYTARKIVDSGILDAHKDSELLLLLMSILKKEDDWLKRTEVMLNQALIFQTQIITGYVNPSFFTGLSNSVNQMLKKQTAPEVVMKQYLENMKEQSDVGYGELMVLYRSAVELLENNYNIIV